VNVPAPPSGPYFYLSHASTPAGIDHWVSVFFQDLKAEVTRLARKSVGAEVGFVDAQPPGSERDEAVMRARVAAQVMVVLYSPDYVDRDETSREIAAFRLRIPPSRAHERPGHIQPVLWAPLHPGQDADFLDRALELGAEFDEYAQLGLGAMCRISRYREHYRDVVHRLASRVVEVAEQFALTAVSPGQPAETPARAGALHFIVAVIAPNENQLPKSRDPDCYGPMSFSWRPFRNAHRFPIADHTSHEAQLLKMPTRIVDFAAGDPTLAVSPGVILVDPWIISLQNGEPMLRAAFAMLRHWVSLVVVVDRNDRQYGREVAEMASRVMRMRQSHDSQLVRDAKQFKQLIPRIVLRARRSYLSDGPTYPPSGPFPPRERLIDPNDKPPAGMGGN
jgi:FxsC-like protein